MTQMTYNYKQVNGKFYPIIEIEANCRKQSKIECYIDSGSSISAFHQMPLI